MSAGQLIVPYASPALLSNGDPSPGSTLTVFNTGTDTLATLYADFGLTTTITNPLIAVAGGRFTEQSTVIWASDAQAYDIQLAFSDGSNLSFDNIFVLEGQSNTSGFAPINSPNFTGVPTAPTPATNDNSNKIATTAYVQNQNYAPLASPAFTGGPTAPTPASNDDSTRLATTAFVQSLFGSGTISLTPNGYYIFPNGLVIQWGSFSALIGGGGSGSFPHAFPNGCFSVLGQPSAANGTNNTFLMFPASTTNFTWSWPATTSGSSFTVYWFAVGN